MRTMTTISSVIRASEARRARSVVPLVTRALFRHPSGTNVPLRAERDYPLQRHATARPQSRRPSPQLARLTLQCAAKPQRWQHGQPAHAATHRVNVRLKGPRQPPVDLRLHVSRHSHTPPTTQRGHDRRTRPRPRRDCRTNQMRKGSFLTSSRPFHHAPRPSVSPALVSGIRMRTSA